MCRSRQNTDTSTESGSAGSNLNPRQMIDIFSSTKMTQGHVPVCRTNSDASHTNSLSSFGEEEEEDYIDAPNGNEKISVFRLRRYNLVLISAISEGNYVAADTQTVPNKAPGGQNYLQMSLHDGSDPIKTKVGRQRKPESNED